ncbi:MAG: exodeoxyribonuclease III, partial [Armatimonadetes bacterium]|nr:exodeoxyribonuclease III [Armatimonadota bacterium]
MRLATYNVNSIRARMPRVLEWLEEAQPDVVALQETKVEDDKFPVAEIEAAGYHVAFHGQQKYNGVAFLSKVTAEDFVAGYAPGFSEDCRVVRAVFDGVMFINTYVPNGTVVGGDKWAYKMAWLEQFNGFVSGLASPGDKVLWLGDINIAPTAADVYDHERLLGEVGHHPDEFSRLQNIVDWGWTDVFRLQGDDPGHYTFWDFR